MKVGDNDGADAEVARKGEEAMDGNDISFVGGPGGFLTGLGDRRGEEERMLEDEEDLERGS